MIGKPVSKKEAARLKAVLGAVEGSDAARSISIWTEFTFRCKSTGTDYADVKRLAQEAKARIEKEIVEPGFRVECLRQYDLVLARISEFDVEPEPEETEQ